MINHHRSNWLGLGIRLGSGQRALGRKKKKIQPHTGSGPDLPEFALWLRVTVAPLGLTLDYISALGLSCARGLPKSGNQVLKTLAAVEPSSFRYLGFF